MAILVILAIASFIIISYIISALIKGPTKHYYIPKEPSANDSKNITINQKVLTDTSQETSKAKSSPLEKVSQESEILEQFKNFVREDHKVTQRQSSYLLETNTAYSQKLKDLYNTNLYDYDFSTIRSISTDFVDDLSSDEKIGYMLNSIVGLPYFTLMKN